MVQSSGWTRKLLRRDHPDTLVTINNIALLYNSQGEYRKALEWYGRALAGFERSLRRDHPDILSTVNNIALVYDNQGDYSKAVDWYDRALAWREKSLGKEHPYTISTASRWSIAKVKAKTGKLSFSLASIAAGMIRVYQKSSLPPPH
jgi:tetratricopeptide (TPR) repeat protein